MPKFKNNDFSCSIEEFIAPLKENGKNDYVKGVARIKWGDNPTTLDIRNINLATNNAYKGISLSDEEADELVNILLDEGYGSIDKIKEVIKTRESVFDYMNKEEARENNDNLEPIHIIVPED